MKVIIDNAIPFIHGAFEPFADVEYLPGGAITREDCLKADALIIRTRTKCRADLLDGTPVKMIATATIGTDHIDMDYCGSHGIYVQNAAGCNAGGVMDYVFSALYGCAARKSMDLAGKTIGIVGVGHVGSKVEQMARSLGFKVLLCDPPRAEAEGPSQFCDLDTLLEGSDIVTMHVPLLPTTRGMCNEDFFEKIKFGAFFINAARGEILVDSALKTYREKLGAVAIDTWNGEPAIDRELLSMVDIATPHIAGYSLQGKINGTVSAVRSTARFFGIGGLYDFFPTEKIENVDAVRVNVAGMSQGQIASIIQYNYPIFTDDFMLRVDPGRFEKLREEYSYRREFYIA